MLSSAPRYWACTRYTQFFWFGPGGPGILGKSQTNFDPSFGKGSWTSTKHHCFWIGQEIFKKAPKHTDAQFGPAVLKKQHARMMLSPAQGSDETQNNHWFQGWPKDPWQALKMSLILNSVEVAWESCSNTEHPLIFRSAQRSWAGTTDLLMLVWAKNAEKQRATTDDERYPRIRTNTT